MRIYANTCHYMPLHELGHDISRKAITSCIRIGAAMKLTCCRSRCSSKNMKWLKKQVQIKLIKNVYFTRLVVVNQDFTETR